MTEIIIPGHIPSKKNQLKLTHSGRGYYDQELRARLNEINESVASQWRVSPDIPRGPLVNPGLGFIFYVTPQGLRSDRDNKMTSVMDGLVQGGVLKDDCIREFNGPVMIGSAVTTNEYAGCVVLIEENGDGEKLWRRLNNYRLLDLSVLRRPMVRRAFKRL